jgi:hypothetical protein
MSRSVSGDLATISSRVNRALGKSTPHFDFATNRAVCDAGSVTVMDNGLRGDRVRYRLVTVDGTGKPVSFVISSEWMTFNQLRAAVHAYVAKLRA